jgi:hypothetical protein
MEDWTGWLDELAAALGVSALEDADRSALLQVSRAVAHGVERRATPLAAYLVGAAVERRRAGGESGEDALAGVLAGLRAALPAAGGEGGAGP